MDLIIGFLVGYVLGAKGGHEKFEELKEAWNTIAGTAEFQRLTMTGLPFINHIGRQVQTDESGENRPMAERISELLNGQLSQVLAPFSELRKAA